ncbi:MAG: YceI family protein [Paludibacter sp.]
MKRIIFLLFLVQLMIVAGAMQAQSVVSIDLQRNSSLTINGSTNLLTFKLVQNGDKLLRKTQTLKATESKNKVYLSDNKLSIAVKNFSSNNKIALDGFLDLLKAETHPNLNVEFNYLEVPTVEKDETLKTKTLVSFTITGVTKQYTIPITATHVGDQYTINGNKSINIRDFGLVPPVKMMGLVRVSEWINIEFHLICNVVVNGATADLTLSK